MKPGARLPAELFTLALVGLLISEMFVLITLLLGPAESEVAFFGYTAFFSILGVFAELVGLGFWGRAQTFPQLFVCVVALYSLSPSQAIGAVVASRISASLVRVLLGCSTKRTIELDIALDHLGRLPGKASTDLSSTIMATLGEAKLWKGVSIQVTGAFIGYALAAGWIPWTPFTGLEVRRVTVVVCFLLVHWFLTGLDYCITYGASISRTALLFLGQLWAYGLILAVGSVFSLLITRIHLGPTALYAFLLYVALLSYALWLNLGVSETYKSTIEGLTCVIENRYRYMVGHGATVALLSAATARKLALSDKMVARVYWAAYVHDIGMLGINDELFDKETPLTYEEWLEMSRHVVEGYRLSTMIPFLSLCTAGPLYHHERYDGSGYPMGLKGRAIPLEARVVALADAYHSMIWPRPYRPARTHDEAVCEIKRLSGAWFDPGLTDVFIRVCDEFQRWGIDAFDRIYNIHNRC
ncbi:MAG TPA: HD domain-containing protein [Clostridia bacterium]|nr:HD domain-containing protein [Clostridia bacterium]